jgi:thiol-disulfide isomerase/thioredoxin
MKRVAIGLTVLAGAILSLRAADDPAKDSDAYKALRTEIKDAEQQSARELREARAAVQAAKTDADKAAAQEKLEALEKNAPLLKIKLALRLLDFAENNPKDPKANEAAVLAFDMSQDPNAKLAGRDARRSIIKYLRDNVAAKPEIKQVLKRLMQAKDPAGEALYREVMAKNPDARMQGWACKALAAVTTTEGEEEKLNKLLAGKYAEFFPDLTVGKKIPNVGSQDLDGKDVKISDYKGSVVVIDIWATWCGPCRVMIPHEKEMVERLKDKKFKLVSVSIDDEKKTLADFVEKENMKWTHWWAGRHTGWVEDWDVKFIPTIYVVDAAGVIRFKDVRGEKLEEAVNELLKEVEEKDK